MKFEANEYHNLAQLRGFKWVGSVPKNTLFKTRWRCPHGHEWEAAYSDINKGTNCPYCAGLAPKSADDYRALAAKRGITWTGTVVPSTVRIKTTWRCQEGHEWAATHHCINMSKMGCPICAHVRRKPADDYRILAESRGFEWVGAIPRNSLSKTRWRCTAGHEWLARYRDIKDGTGCPFCLRVDESDYHSAAAEHGLEWVGGTIPRDTTIKTTWRCPKGHVWEAKYNGVTRGSGCPYCASNASKTQDDYRKVASDYDLEWIGVEVPTNNKSKTQWRCKNGHEFFAHYNSVAMGHGCPDCDNRINGVRVSKPQLAIGEMLNGEINVRTGRYTIDIALQINGVKIAAEYDCWYWHQGHELRDAKRDKFLAEHSWCTLRIKSGVLIPTREQLDTAIAQLIGGATYAEIILDDWRSPISP